MMSPHLQTRAALSAAANHWPRYPSHSKSGRIPSFVPILACVFLCFLPSPLSPNTHLGRVSIQRLIIEHKSASQHVVRRQTAAAAEIMEAPLIAPAGNRAPSRRGQSRLARRS